MSTVTYYFDSYSTGETWANTPANLADGSTSTNAYTNTDGDIELLNDNTCPGTDLGTITKVELRVYGNKQVTFRKGDIILRPVFSGSSDGDNHTFTPASSAAWSSYYDITSDTNAPGTWSWSDVVDLDCDVEFDRDSGNNYGYARKVEIRITYTESGSTEEEDFTADAIIEKEVSDDFTANSVVEKTVSDDFIANAVIERTESDSLTIDAVVGKTASSTFSADAAIQRTEGDTLTANAVIERIESDTFTADANIASASSTIPGDFTADAVVEKSAAGDFAGDAVIQKTESDSFPGDAVVEKTESDTLLANAVIQKTSSGSFTADAYIPDTTSDSFTADAYLWPAGTPTDWETFTADAVVQRAGDWRFLPANAVIANDYAATWLNDAVLLRAESNTFTADALIVDTIADTFTLDSAIQRTESGQFTSDAVVQNERGSGMTANSVLQNEIGIRQETGYFWQYDNDEKWTTNPAYMVNTLITQNAIGVPGDTQLCTASTLHSAINGITLDRIDRVHVRIYLGHQYAGIGIIGVQPVFEGTTDGSIYVVHAEASVDTYSDWIDITFDSQAPTVWTQEKIDTLDLRVLNLYDQNAQVAATEIMVTQTPAIFCDAVISAPVENTLTADAYINYPVYGDFTADAVIKQTAGSLDAKEFRFGSVDNDYNWSAYDEVNLQCNIIDGSIATYIDGIMDAGELGGSLVLNDAQLTYPLGQITSIEIGVYFWVNVWITEKIASLFGYLFIPEQASTSGSMFLTTSDTGAWYWEDDVDVEKDWDALLSSQLIFLPIVYIWPNTLNTFKLAEVRIRIESELTFTADAWIATREEGDFTGDAVIQTEQSDSFTADAVIFGVVVDNSFQGHATIKATSEDSLTADAVIYKIITDIFMADAVISTLVEDSFAAASAIQRVESDTIAADAVIFNTIPGTFTADAQIFSTIAGAFTADALLLPRPSPSASPHTGGAGALSSQPAAMGVTGVALAQMTTNASVGSVFASAPVTGHIIDSIANPPLTGYTVNATETEAPETGSTGSIQSQPPNTGVILP